MPDFRVCETQRLGQWWVAQATDFKQASSLLDGTLTLPPHPAWRFPKDLKWDADPFQQKNWRFQLHCLKWLEPVRREAMKESETADELKDFWNKVVDSWLSENLQGDDKFAWMDMADGVRAIELVLGAPIASEELYPRLLKGIEVHVKKLADPQRRAIGNHALHQLLGLFVAARFLELDDYVEYAVSELGDLFTKEYDSQGTNAEASLSYHDLNYRWWDEAISRLEVEGISWGPQQDLLNRSRSNLVHFVRPDGFLEMIGDTGERKVLSSDGSPENEYVRSKGLSGTPPLDVQRTLDAGYAAGRSGWGGNGKSFEEETFYSLRFGQNKAVHGHDDLGSITAFADGVPWIVDPGMYAYQSHPFRRFFLSREAHNVVLSPGAKTQKDEASLVWSHSSHEADVYHVEASPYEGYSIHRTFAYLRTLDCFMVYDSVKKASHAAPEMDFVQRWNLHPTVKAGSGLRSATLEHDGKKATMRWLYRPQIRVSAASKSPLAGWFSPEYSVATPTSYIDVAPSPSANMSWLTIISVNGADAIPLSFSSNGDSLLLKLDMGSTRALFESNTTTANIWHSSSAYSNK